MCCKITGPVRVCDPLENTLQVYALLREQVLAIANVPP